MLTRLLFAENIWDAEKQRARAHLVYNCGRADDPASTLRLRWPAKGILRRCAPEEIVSERRLAAAECLDWSGLLRALELTGARPKELAASVVADFDGQMLRLAHRMGRPAKLRPRHVLLSVEGMEFFREQSRDKLPGAPLFTEDGETPWRRHVWAKEVRITIGTRAQSDESLGTRARIASAMLGSVSCYNSMESTQ